MKGSKMNMKKKMISLLLVLALVVGICPAAFAGEETVEEYVPSAAIADPEIILFVKKQQIE